MKKFTFWAIALFAIGVQPAFAYIDPGSGSAIMSVVIGFFVAIGVVIKSFWYKIKSLLGFSRAKKEEAAADNNDLSEQDGDGK